MLTKKYYLSEKMIKYAMSSGTKDFYVKPEIDLEIARPITTKQDKRAGTTNYITDKLIQVAQLDGFESSGRMNKFYIQNNENNNLSPTLDTRCDCLGVVVIDGIEYRIRKLTPKECWRLMGLSDTDFDKTKASGMSNAQLYKQAGNGIVVNVLMAIFKNLNRRVK